jgi:hypothetical protein
MQNIDPRVRRTRQAFLTRVRDAALLQTLSGSEDFLRKRSPFMAVLGLLTLSACSDPASTPDAAINPTQISVAGGQGGGTIAAVSTGGSGGSAGSGGSSSSSSGGASPAATGGTVNPPEPPPWPPGMVPDYTPEQFCGMLRVDEGGALVIAGCEVNIRSIYSLEREQIDGGTWHSTSYGFEAPCNAQGTYRAEVSDVRYGVSGLVESYLFLIRSQGGYEFGGSLAIAYEAARLASASGQVQGNSCQFTVCSASECGILDTTQLSSVRGDGGAGSTPSGSAGLGGSGGTGNGGRPSSSAGASGAAGPASTGGRSGFPGAPAGSGGGAGRSTGGSNSGFPPLP